MKTRFLLLPLSMVGLFAVPAHAEYCREFTNSVYVGGRLQQAYGTSCLQPDGAWQVTQQPVVQQAPMNYVQPITYVQPVSYVQPVQYYPRPYYTPSVFSLSFNSGPRWGYRDHHHGGGWGGGYGRGRGHGHGGHW